MKKVVHKKSCLFVYTKQINAEKHMQRIETDVRRSETSTDDLGSRVQSAISGSATHEPRSLAQIYDSPSRCER